MNRIIFDIKEHQNQDPRLRRFTHVIETEGGGYYIVDTCLLVLLKNPPVGGAWETTIANYDSSFAKEVKKGNLPGGFMGNYIFKWSGARGNLAFEKFTRNFETEEEALQDHLDVCRNYRPYNER